MAALQNGAMAHQAKAENIHSNNWPREKRNGAMRHALASGMAAKMAAASCRRKLAEEEVIK